MTSKTVKSYLSFSVNPILSSTIHDDNVFCTCPGCGCEIGIDIAELFSDGESDLYGTSVYCTKCSRSRLEARYE